MISPDYSIVMPVYRRIYGFEEALRSARNVVGCTEIVVVDDHSDHDDFESICRATGDSRIRYVKNETNIGLFGNWNRGIELARGEFVSVLCSDDLVVADAYTRFLEAYRADPAIDVYFGTFCTFTKVVEDAIVLREFPPGPMPWKDLVAEAIDHGPGFPVLSIIRRSKALEMPFVARPHSGNDWLWIYSNASRLRLHADGQAINYWRRHPNQDAALSQPITTDCWLLMYLNMAEQLRAVGDPRADKAMRCARGVVLNWLLNEYQQRDNYYPRLLDDGAKSNLFLSATLDVVRDDWLLRGLLRARPGESLYYNLGRIARKIRYYPSPFNPLPDQSTVRHRPSLHAAQR
jgi:glycosyltransferase involved in cell wall biosynthesis